MTKWFGDLEYIRAYIDNLLCMISSTWEDHLKKLDKIFTWLTEACLKVNAKKSFFGKSELEYLGYWITQDGIQPVSKKVEVIKNLTASTTKCGLHSFIGMVNYYHDM